METEMTPPASELPESDFARAEREQLRAWLQTSTEERIAFFEEMVELAYKSGALTPERLAMRNVR